MAYEDKVVDVVVTLGTQPIDTVGFETPMFLAIHNVFPERQRSYTSTQEMVDDGFAVGSPAHQFASNVFAGAFRPSMVTIGREELENVTVDFTGQVNTETVTLNISSGALVKAIKYVITGTPATPQAIVTALVAAITADTELSAAGVTATGTGSILTIAGTGAYSVGRGTGNYVLTNVAGSETVATVLPLILDENANWYFLSTESHVDADIIAAAQFASTNYKLHVYSTAKSDNWAPNNVTTSIADKLADLSYDSLGIADPLADSVFPEGALIGVMAANDPSYGDSIHLKELKGVTDPKWSGTQRMAIWNRNLNFYRTINGVGAFNEGKCASGQYVDVIRFSHWLKFRLEESVFGHMYRRSNMGLSVKMSDDDLPSLKSVMMNNPINVGIRNGSILTGYDSVTQTFYDPVITIPKRSQIPTNDLAARILRDVKVELVYNNALHFVRIRASVLLDRTSSAATGQTFTTGA